MAVGCLEVSQVVCTSCRASSGYFSDGFETTQSGQPVICRTLPQHEWSIHGVREDSNNVLAPIFNRSVEEVFSSSFERYTSLTNYAEFKDGYVVMNGTIKNYTTNTTGGGPYQILNFGSNVGEDLPYYDSYSKYTSRDRRPEMFKCFFFSKMCAVVNDLKVDIGPQTDQMVQQVFMFNATKATYNGVIHRNIEARDGKFISNLLPITKSSYLIIGFSTISSWPVNDSTVLLRTNYLETSQQFQYKLPNTYRQISCFRLLYIEYSKYFIASFSEENGVLLYDLTQNSQNHQRIFRPEDDDYRHLAYLEASKVLLMAANSRDRLYGYSMSGNDLYHIHTRPSVRGLVSFKSSDFFVIMSSSTSSNLYVYNLQGMVHQIELSSSTYVAYVFYSEYLGGLFLLDDNILVRYSWSIGTNNPSCGTSSTSDAYSFSNKWCSKSCSSTASLTNRGICEFSQDTNFLIYLSNDVPNNLPTNLLGEVFKLSNNDLNGPAGDEGDRLQDSKFIRVIILVVGVIVLGLILIVVGSVLYYLCQKIYECFCSPKQPSKIDKKTKKIPQNQSFQVLQPRPPRDQLPRINLPNRRANPEISRRVQSQDGEANFNKIRPQDQGLQRNNELKEIEKLRQKNESLEQRMLAMEEDMNRKKEEMDKEMEALGIMQGGIPQGIPVQPINNYNVGPRRGESAEVEIMGIDVIRESTGPQPEPARKDMAKNLQGNFNYPSI